MLVAGLGQCSWDTLFFVETYPPVDAKQEATDITEQGGGPVATALVALRRLGVDCRFAGVAGKDRAGREIRESLVSEGVAAEGLVLREGHCSQLAYIAVEQRTARRTIFWQRPTGGQLMPDEIPDGFLDGATLVMLDGLMPEASIYLAKEARQKGIPVVLDAGRMRDGMTELAALSDHVVGSEVFGLELGLDPGAPEEFYRQAMKMPGLLTITLGADGCLSFTPDGIIRLPAFDVGAVDTTGAGDVFHAGYAYGVLNGFEMERTLRFASAAAALSTRGLGGRSALPTVGEVEELL